MGTIAVIDIGSNSIRLQISKFDSGGYKVIEEYRDILRIGDEVFNYGIITDMMADRIYSSMSAIGSLMSNYDVDVVKAVATASFRKAANSKEIVGNIENLSGIKVDVIDGKKEAYYSYLAASFMFQLDKFNALIIDIGGGSAEFSLSRKGVLESSESLELGCSYLTKKIIKEYPVDYGTVSYLRDYIRDYLVNNFVPLGKDIDLVICTGGTMNNVGVMYSALKGKVNPSTTNYVSRKFVKKLMTEIIGKDLNKIKKIRGMEERRADIMLGAICSVDLVLEQTKCDGLYTFTAGVRTGITIETIKEMGGDLRLQGSMDDIRDSRLVEIGNKYFFNEKHAKQVEKLSAKLFEGFKDLLQLKSSDYEYLRAAAILHDIGNYVSYSRHHIHSFYLIRNADIVSYDDTAINIIAYIAKYHRKPVPEVCDEISACLQESDILKVRKLAAILRIADVLDRSHYSSISSVSVVDFADKVELHTTSGMTSLYSEQKGFEKKKDLMESILKKPIFLQ